MLAFPSAGWTQDDAAYDADSPVASAPFAADWRLAGDSVSHVFTHFSLSMDVAVAGIEDPGPATDWHRVRPASLPTLMRKVWTVARREV
jgi:A/G-specific adenine glycosylase